MRSRLSVCRLRVALPHDGDHGAMLGLDRVQMLLKCILGCKMRGIVGERGDAQAEREQVEVGAFDELVAAGRSNQRLEAPIAGLAIASSD